MKRILLATVAALFTSAAYAADPFVYEPETPAPILDAPSFSWTGFYVGVNAGYGGGKAKADATLDDGVDYLRGNASITGSGFIAGVQAGYNWQSGSMVYGIETDIQWSGIEAEGSVGLTDGVDFVNAEVGSSIEWFGTTRLRIGYTPVERFMVYATGGVAYGKTEVYANANWNGTAIGGSLSETRVGWTVGGGAEYAFTDNLSLKTEYLYTDLGEWDLYNGPIGGGLNLQADTSFRFHTVRAGLNFRF